MDILITHQEAQNIHQNQHLKLCLPLVKLYNQPNPFHNLGIWVSNSLQNLHCKPRFSNGDCLKRLHFYGKMVNNTMELEGLIEREGVCENVVKVEAFEDLAQENECIESSSSSDFPTSEITGSGHCSSDLSSSSPHCSISDVSEELHRPSLDDKKLDKQVSALSEIEMMKERFTKLLLGEDMSGCGNGVCTALAISNAITNLCATLFGQLWRLEPFASEKKAMWRREIEWLVCVSDHIVELIPSLQTFPDGSKVEVMTCRPRSDLYINLPALRKLDIMLLEILDSFDNTDFWYVDQGIVALEPDGSPSLQKAQKRQEEKWWLPVPRVPLGGLSENSRKELQHKRDCTNQILKAAMAINSITLADMEVPESYLELLPKNGRSSLGDLIYRYITSEQFSPECLLDCIDLSSEHQALEIANRVEASHYVWRKRNNSKPVNGTNRSNSKSSWDIMKELMVDNDKRELLADRAESLLFCLKQRFPGLPQTTLDMSKIQHNKDVGKSILESYSRVLESLAFNIVSRIDDLLYVDDLTKHSDQHFSLISKVGVIGYKSMSTPCKTAFCTPSFSPAHLLNSPGNGERLPFLSRDKLLHRGFGVKKALTDYLSIETKEKERGNEIEDSDLYPKSIGEVSARSTGVESSVCSIDDLYPKNSVVEI